MGSALKRSGRAVDPAAEGYELLVRFPGELELWRRRDRYGLAERDRDGTERFDGGLDWPETRCRIRAALSDGRLVRST